MKAALFPAIKLAIFMCGSCLAAESIVFPLELGTLKAGGKSYEGVKVTGADAVGIRIMHEGGTARVAYEVLPPDVAARFPRDPAAAKAQKEKEAAELAAHEADMERAAAGTAKVPELAVKKAAETADGDDAGEPALPEPVEDMPKLEGKAAAERIAALEAYIARLEAGKEKTRAYIQRRTERMKKSMEAGVRTYVDQNGRKFEDITSTRKGYADTVMGKLGEEQDKISRADKLIRDARVELRNLKEE